MIIKSKLWLIIFVLISGIIFLFPFTLLAQTTITCGQTMTGSISTAGEKDDYTLTASANDKVTIRLVVTSGGMNPYLELYDSGMTKIAYNYSSSGNYTSIDKTLVAGGTYTIRVYDYGNDETGDYNLIWQKLNNPCDATAIGCGVTASGSLSTAAEFDFYNFTAIPNDKVTIRLVRTSGNMDPYLELYDSTGTRIDYEYTTSGNYVRIDATLSTGGTYTIVVSDYGKDETGDYNVTWQRLNNPCNATAFPCGQTISSSLSAAGEQDFYTFTATAGDKVTIRLIVTSGDMNPYLELYDSTGARVAYDYTTSGNYVRMDATLSVGGIYTVVVSDYGKDETGDYNLTWQRLNNPCNATSITCGQTTSSSLSAAQEQDFYTLTATADDKVTIRLVRISGTMDPYLELYSSTGTRIAYDYTTSGNYAKIDATLSAGGTYIIAVSDYGNDETGNYNITWQRLNNPCNATSICGQTVSGSISTAGEQDYYTFTGSANDNVVLTLTKTSGNFDPSLELYDSSGTRIAYEYTTSGSSVTINKTLSQSGTYIAIVSDYGNDETGDYTLMSQSSVTVLSPNGGEILEAGSTFTITWKIKGPLCISSQEIKLSTDGGITFPNIITTGLSVNERSFTWNIPANLLTTDGRIRITVTDTSGDSLYDVSDADFMIIQDVPKISRTYEYDKLNRLIGIIYEDGKEDSYTYDSVGNRISLSGTGGSEETVQKVYIGYYQRPADPEGLIYWAARLDAKAGNLNEIIEAFANSAESQALYGTINSSNISTVVTNIYSTLFGRSPDTAGLNYYVNGFNSGQFTAATIMLNVLNGAQNEDLLSVNNKLTAANLFTKTIDPELDGTDFQATYSGNADAQKARDFLSTITFNPVTIPTQAEATAYIKTNIADSGDPILEEPSGQTYTR